MDRMLNCWRVKLNGEVYGILPAHTTMFKNQQDKWIPFPSLPQTKHLDWRIPCKWKQDALIKDDFAWAKLNKDELQDDEYFKCEITSELDYYVNGNFYFNQYFNLDGVMSKNPSVGKIKGILYPSPGTELYESVGIGFKGLSGAVCLDDDSKFVGMFIRRGADLGIHKSRLIESKSNLPMRRGIIMPPSVMISHIKTGGVSIYDG